MKAALDLPPLAKESLKGGFWPRSRFTPFEANRFQEDGTLCKEFATNVPHLGRRGDCPAESFRVARDVYVGYFLAIRPADESQTIPFGLQEHSQIQILMSIIPIVFGCNTGHQPSLII